MAPSQSQTTCGEEPHVNHSRKTDNRHCFRVHELHWFSRARVDGGRSQPGQIDIGIHYYLAEAELLEKGYESDPIVHFAEGESPAFLHPAVRMHLQQLGQAAPVTQEN